MNTRPLNTNRTPAPEPTAAQAYAARRAEIARLLDVLEMELDRHAEETKADPKNWARTGDMTRLRDDLINIAAYMSNSDPEAIHEFLDDANAQDEDRRGNA